MNWKQQEYFNGSSVAEYKHSISQHTATTQWCIVNHCVVNVCKIQYVFRNKNNDKVNVWTFSKRDYYHLDNKWCCCYEIKCSQNRMELSAKQKYKNKTSKQQNNRQTCYTHTHTCEWWNEFSLNNEESILVLRVCDKMATNVCHRNDTDQSVNIYSTKLQ